MIDFLEKYKPLLIYVAIVILAVVVLYFITRFIHQWLLKKEEAKFPGEKSTSLKLLKTVLNTLWLVLGIIALSFIFVEEESYGELKSDFKLALYLGFLAVITIITAATTNLWFKRSIREKIKQNQDPTNLKFLRYVAVFSICFIGILFSLLAFPSLEGIAQTALGGAGVIVIIAGVASQEALSNLIGGIFIISFKPFKIYDIIQITDSLVGTVTDITLRHTIIRSFDNKMIVIPNSVINKERLINYNLGELKNCKFVEMNISYTSDVKLAKQIMQEECEKHPLILDNRSAIEKLDGKPIVKTALTKINDSTMTIRAWAWSKSFVDSFDLQCDVNETIKARFDAHAIDLAYPTRTIIIEKDTE
ncbi:mechanosensitive ion channel family protein [Polaribacter sp. IC073]|uniref:mechanosensitive ion channel family protein n=1 Tax=Polaribacter sp. IC073 TaxID=2508540 RepID=UPI0011BDD671|nr:mechanosensitive ion channel family protein [Polaribacter sp. IC073]TXD47223.1 mechanosensitive ion channel family protein [Polaribacter sp. IC073]